ncbi:hypothetical protein BD413DRAFT_251361 [Trametes elegans]|nr:hypothetical protein BD413DRAFT_251361 [Trametes elegans]
MLRLCNADVSVNTSFLAMCLFLLAAKTTLSCSSTHLPPIHGKCHPESSASVAALHSCARPLWLWYTIVRRADITQARQQPDIRLSVPSSPYAPPRDYRTLLAIAVALLMICPSPACAALQVRKHLTVGFRDPRLRVRTCIEGDLPSSLPCSYNPEHA